MAKNAKYAWDFQTIFISGSKSWTEGRLLGRPQEFWAVHDDHGGSEEADMYVIFPAVDVIDESYLALVAQENENPPSTGLRPSPRNTPASPFPAPPTFHDTRPEQERAELEIARQNAAATADSQVPNIVIPKLTQLQPATDRKDLPDSLYTPLSDPALPDLVPADLSVATPPDLRHKKLPKVNAVIPMASSNAGQYDSANANGGAGAAAGQRRPAVPIRDLIHPSLNEPLKSQQQVTFRLIKAGKKIQFEFSRFFS